MSRGLVWGLAAVLAGCAFGGVPSGELPESPIAVAYLTHEQSQRRADMLADRDRAGLPGAEAARRQELQDRDGVAPIEDVQGLMENVLGSFRDPSIPTGRLALLYPRSGRVERVESVRRAAVPHAWSQDGTRLVFSQLEDRLYQLYEYNRETGEVRRLTDGPRTHPAGCYLGDGRFAFMALDLKSLTPDSRIWLTEPGGARSRAKPISDGPFDEAPACAPDGSALAWTATDQRGRRTLMVRSPPAEGPTRALGPGRDPAFSGDSRWLVYSAPYQRKSRIWRIRPDGTGRVRIGGGALMESQPAISRDGQYVVYLAGDHPDRLRLYVRRFDGTGERILLANGVGEHPVW